MSCASFESLVRKISGKADVLYFHVKGEPLLHPHLTDLLDIARRAGFAVHLTTNGTLLEKECASLLHKDNLEKINISLHSLPQFSKNEQKRLTASILESSEKLCEANRKTNPRFLISLRLWTKDNVGETAEGIRIIEDFYSLENGFIAGRLESKNSMIVHPGLVIHTAETFVWPSLDGTDFGPSGWCLALRDQAGILVDGTVVPCCLDGDGIISLGNIFTSEWDEIMASPRARGLYDGFSRRLAVEPLCQRCGFRTRFNGA